MSQTEVTGDATISDERASEIITDKIQDGLKSGAIKISDSVMDVLKKGGDWLKNTSEMDRDQIREAIREATTVRIGQVDTVDDIDTSLAAAEAAGDFDVNERSLVSNEGTGFMLSLIHI